MSHKSRNEGKQPGFLGSLFEGTALGQAMVSNRGELPYQKLAEKQFQLDEQQVYNQALAQNQEQARWEIEQRNLLGQPTEAQKFARQGEQRLRQEYGAQLAGFDTLQGAVKDIFDLNRGSTAVQSTAAIVKLAKALDPESVVRESETGTIISSQSIPGQLTSLLNKALSGGAADEEILKAIQQTGLDLYRNAVGGAEATRQQYEELSRRQGLNPMNVTTGLGIDWGFNPQVGGIVSQAAKAPAAAAPPSSNKGPLPEGIPEPF